jgi:peptidoglycan/LPS O-acetylase OafA/YrhL
MTAATLPTEHTGPSETIKPFAHFSALDGLRGIAILWVVLHNSPYYSLAGETSAIVKPIALIGSMGWVGVQLFFVLSGFLITGNLLDSRRATNYYRTFFARRVLRIFPLYYLALFVGLIVVPVFFPGVGETGSPLDQVWLWTFLFNWAHPLGTATFGFAHFWSLAVEEQFYLVWPFVIYRVAPTKMLRVCIWIAIAALIIRVVMRLSGASAEMVYEYTVCRMDALAIGAAAAILIRTPHHRETLSRHAAKLLPIALAVAFGGACITWLYTRDNFSTETIGFSILAIIFGLVVLACVVDNNARGSMLRKILTTAPLRSVGKYSYGMYVLHIPIVNSMARLLPSFHSHFGKLYPIPFLTTIFVLTYAAGALSYHLLEKRFLELKRQFEPSTMVVAAQSAASSA